MPGRKMTPEEIAEHDEFMRKTRTPNGRADLEARGYRRLRGGIFDGCWTHGALRVHVCGAYVGDHPTDAPMGRD